ncbi:MAG TPA: hypothetical protein VK208_00435 [Pyrinomonadaceae bacterium]|nr:hypothetical protein [Pyrinomonadaceae bacterium]
MFTKEKPTLHHRAAYAALGRSLLFFLDSSARFIDALPVFGLTIIL